jgi:hypothetical protein
MNLAGSSTGGLGEQGVPCLNKNVRYLKFTLRSLIGLQGCSLVTTINDGGI